MPLRVAFDLDGVLADMESELVRQAEILFGEVMTRRLQERDVESGATASAAAEKLDETPRDPSAVAEGAPDNVPPLLKLKMTSREQRRLWRHVESIDNFWETLQELEPGVIQRLASIATDRRWEVIFLTKRPESAGATAQLQSQRWLQSRGFTLPSVYVVQGSRGRIAAALGLDVVVDDRPENCLDVVVDSKARAILVWRESETTLPPAARRLGIGVVKTVDECITILTQLDAPAEQRSGVVERVLRLLGLKEPAQAS
jgi:hypothetical protein